MTTTELSPRIAILGAGGRAGRAITATATERGYAVTAIVRDPDRSADLNGPGVRVVVGDALAASSIIHATTDAQALVSAVTPFTAPPVSFEGFDTGFYARVADSLLAAAHENAIERVVVVGLFATLRAPGGGPVADDPELFPEALRPFAHAHAAGIEHLRSTGAGVDWLVLAPPPALGPDTSSSGYELGGPTMDQQRWQTPLSYADLAAAVTDQIARPTHHREHVAVYGT